MTLETWNIDPSHSGIGFSVRHMVIARVRGRFGQWSGVIDLDESDLSRSSVKVRIDAASIDTKEPRRDEHLRSADFFDVANHPELVFESRRVVDLGEGDLRVIGELTIRGITREVELEGRFAGRARDPWGGERVAFEATTTINRKDFGLGWNQVLETGGVLVGEKVEIALEVQAVQAAAASDAA
jgi:polyisoprenoid-binding protein YceI